MYAARCSTEGFFLLSFLLPQLLQGDLATPPWLTWRMPPYSGKEKRSPYPTPLYLWPRFLSRPK